MYVYAFYFLYFYASRFHIVRYRTSIIHHVLIGCCCR